MVSLKQIRPSSGCSSPATMRASVDLPLPLSPTSPKTSPGRMVSETSDTARKVSRRRGKSDRLMTKDLETLSSLSAMLSAGACRVSTQAFVAVARAWASARTPHAEARPEPVLYRGFRLD